jgi:SM-20-related protein
MSLLDFARFRDAPVAPDPFAHVIVPNFVKPERLAAVLSALPAMRGRGSFPISAVKLGAAGRQMVAEIEGEEFRGIVAEKFGLSLEGAPVMTTLRGNSGEQDGRIHTDSAAKLVTILLYLNPSAGWQSQLGRLRLLRDGKDLEDYAVEVPPTDGALLVFPNGRNTFHGHRKFVGQRYVMQMNYMTTGAKAKAEMRRHHLSAFVKRIMRAA